MNLKKTSELIKLILLGAAGSALWTLGGEPLTTALINFFINTAQTLNNGYYDLLHEEIGQISLRDDSTFLKELALLIFVVLVMNFPMYIYITLNRRIKRNLEEWKGMDADNGDKPIDATKEFEQYKNEKIKKFSTGVKVAKYILIGGIVYAVITIPTIISSLVISKYTHEASIFTERSLDILAPHIDEQKRLQLKAMYRQVSNAKTFYAMFDELQNIAETKNITLPEFKIVR